ncbi:uncharacterized protein LOC111376643 [Olea europaea subsp. europaea]|uniref:Uncharacterized protein LOC111376643 n=1 Tax=Olea europaea subsp. europaea TaxID=158383 RepID=A0A8S0U7X8_OLEEU|nr:uncharacterized protein LOC111376643 [Olea europaea subsp. europaea]
MALNFGTASLHLEAHSLKVGNKKHPFKLYETFTPSPSSLKAAALSEGTESRVTEEESSTSGSSPSARVQLYLLEQLTSGGSSVNGYESDGSSDRLTIRDQLAKLVGDRDDDFSIPLGKNLKKFSAKFLTISQRRSIKRQAYLDEVSQRNDSVFFATIGALVLSPPLVILGIAIATGYVQLFP